MWGDGPSELARLAVARLGPYASPELSILDVGCGYGRDTRYLAAELGCHALGIDGSPAAIEAARKEHAAALRRSREAQFDVEYLVSDVASLAADPEHARSLRHRLHLQRLPPAGADRPPGVRGGARRRHPSRRPPLPEHHVAARPGALRQGRAGLRRGAQLGRQGVPALLHGRGAHPGLLRRSRSSTWTSAATTSRIPARRRTTTRAGSWRGAGAEPAARRRGALRGRCPTPPGTG